MPYLNWIEDQKLVEIVGQVFNISLNSLNEASEDFEKNVLDPFSAIFQIAGFNLSTDQWILSEKTRQAQKSLQNHIGNFHQNILGSVDGWVNMKQGNIIDLVNHDKQIIAEIKNKFDTVTGSNLSDLYRSLENEIMPKSSRYKGFCAYYVTIIPKQPVPIDKPFAPSDKRTGA